MTYLSQKEKLDSLLFYIKNQSAVTVEDLTKRLNLSRRTVLRMVEHHCDPVFQ
jgi:transcriptional antiterminator